MKKIILLLLLSVGVFCSDDYCTSIAKLSETVMQGRQMGFSYREQLSIANNAGELRALMTSIINDAQKVNRYVTEDYQRQSIIDFGDKWFKLCIDAQKK